VDNDENLEIIILIPALNEEEIIEKTINEIPINNKIIVIDNGSTDNTAKIVNKLGKHLIYEEKKGYGYACLAGINYITSSNLQPKYILFVDADGTNHPNGIINIIEQIRNSPTGLIMGSRMHTNTNSMPKHARFANYFFTRLIHLLYKVKLEDMGSLRIIDYQALIDIDMQDTGYGWAAEMIVKIIRKGYFIGEINVEQRPRIGKSKISGSFITSIKAAIALTYYILKYSFKRNI